MSPPSSRRPPSCPPGACWPAHPAQDGWAVTTKGGARFADVDLSEGEWTEYDEKLNASVGVYGLEAKWELHRGK